MLPASPNWPCSISSQKLGSALRRSVGTISRWSTGVDGSVHRFNGAASADTIVDRLLVSTVRAALRSRSLSVNCAM